MAIKKCIPQPKAVGGTTPQGSGAATTRGWAPSASVPGIPTPSRRAAAYAGCLADCCLPQPARLGDYRRRVEGTAGWGAWSFPDADGGVGGPAVAGRVAILDSSNLRTE